MKSQYVVYPLVNQKCHIKYVFFYIIMRLNSSVLIFGQPVARSRYLIDDHSNWSNTLLWCGSVVVTIQNVVKLYSNKKKKTCIPLMWILCLNLGKKVILINVFVCFVFIICLKIIKTKQTKTKFIFIFCLTPSLVTAEKR